MHCRHFGTCGGCSLPAISYEEQLRRKQARLTELLGIDVPPLIASPRQSAFRQKAAFAFGSGTRGLIMGHYATGSKRIVPVEECPVHGTRANRIAFDLRDHLARAGIGASDRAGGILRHVIVRTTEDEEQAIVMLVVTRNDRSLRAPVRRFLEALSAPDGFLLNINDRPGPLMAGGETIRLDGRSHVRQNGVGGADFLIAADAFFQTNVGSARELVRLVVQAAGNARRVLDLYCGSGLFTVPLARGGAAVTAVEENRQAIADLKANLRLNRLDAARVRPIPARVEDAMARVSRDRWDLVILDPPREGCSPGVLDAVFDRIKPPRVVYVSCNPDDLARNLPRLSKSGYRIESLQAVDMFPHTDHIETVLGLERAT